MALEVKPAESMTCYTLGYMIDAVIDTSMMQRLKPPPFGALPEASRRSPTNPLQKSWQKFSSKKSPPRNPAEIPAESPGLEPLGVLGSSFAPSCRARSCGAGRRGSLGRAVGY